MGFDVVVIGNVGVDTNVYLHGEDVDWSREANFTENLDYVGQAGGYSSRGYARLGLRTAFIGHVGEDHNGRLVRETFISDGIDTSAMFVDPTGTARSVNVMYRDGRRKNFYDGKGHMTLQPDVEAARHVLRGARWAHVHLANWARRLLPVCRELGVRIAVDLQDVTDPHEPYRRDFVEAADAVFFSAANHADPEPLIRAFLQGHPSRVVVAGMGADGCAVGTREGVRRFGPEPLELPVVDTNGAGDSLAVGFLSSLWGQGLSLERAVRRGQLAARWCCAQRGTSATLITREELERRDRG